MTDKEKLQAIEAEVERLLEEAKRKLKEINYNDQASRIAWSESIATCGKILTFINETSRASEIKAKKNPHIWDLKGVPLTAEILEKNRFVKNGDVYKYERYAGDGHQSITLYDRMDGLWDVKAVDYDKYNDSESTCEKTNKFLKVHELQHILKDCEITKEINL